MPQLPSGKHFALNDHSLRQLYLAVDKGTRALELMAIEKTADLHRFVDVLYFRPRPGTTFIGTHEQSNRIPDDLEPYLSGFTLETLRSELSQWPEADQQAFDGFMGGGRGQDYLRALLQDVEKVKAALIADGPFVGRVQAAFWKAGLHPLQREWGDD